MHNICWTSLDFWSKIFRCVTPSLLNYMKRMPNLSGTRNQRASPACLGQWAKSSGIWSTCSNGCDVAPSVGVRSTWILWSALTTLAQGWCPWIWNRAPSLHQAASFEKQFFEAPGRYHEIVSNLRIWDAYHELSFRICQTTKMDVSSVSTTLLIVGPEGIRELPEQDG